MRLHALAIGMIVASASAPAFAQSHDPQAAQTLFDDGKKLMNERRYTEACAKFAESNRLDPTLGTILWLGGCYEKVGQTASAWTTFRAAAQIAHDQNDEREAVAREHVEQLAATVFRLKIVVLAEADVPNLEVRRDGVIVPKTAWATDIALDPGAHVVTASAPDRRTFEKSLEAPPAGGSASVTIAPLAPLVVKTEPPPPVIVPARRGGAQRAVGWALAGLGLVGAGFGTAFGLDAKSKNDASNANFGCGGAFCPNQGGVDLRNEALGSALASTITFIAGGVLVAAGITVVLLAPSSSVSVRATALPGGAAASIGGSW